MITSISLNPSIDRTLTVEGFTPGGLNRVLSSSDVAAGKGINSRQNEYDLLRELIFKILASK